MKNIFYFILIILTLSSCDENYKKEKIDPFQYGVASGDPKMDGVLLWTHVSVQDSTEIAEVKWEIARDSLFHDIIQSANTKALLENDHCVKIWVDNLLPDTKYFYRFKYKNETSIVGRTQTLPKKTDTVRLAIVNCSKYEGGFFNVYDAISKMEGLNAVVHLGDYIYEDGGGQKPYLPIIKKTGRKHEPSHNLVSLNDYRLRYKQHRKDSMLQNLHQKYPMINIWDDHEFANNSWKGGVDGHIGDKEGNWNNDKWNQRVENATKAYDEWIPINKNPNEPIYRSFQFADILNLNMLDTRICCRTKQASSNKELDAIAAYSSLLGDKQLNWLESSITNTNTIWNLIGNQVLVARRYLGENNKYIELDQWTGYPKDRARFLDFLAKNPEKNIIITTGNVHDAFHYKLLDGNDEKSGKLIAHEFAPGSVSSGNTGVKKTTEDRKKDSLDLVHKNPHLKWFDLIKHSFIIMEFTKNKAQIDFYQVSTIYKTKYTLKKAYSFSIKPKHKTK
ncbi:alkaline phosphatase D family protein [Polaribacter batillariae]|uniref:Alkaline phosphatase D family protein n=1 Tax=Polaribacter batillariae TaxID=2808900 RepID=A0ABX7SX61_9FLAO|nr:alkaline phosphatase D family protein [Polaribacter batillariae]QTD38472.1 alkaline phosphatase D family protein [Polaribacter batillariae]